MTSPGKKQEPSRRDEMMNASCYLWKWAENNLPGKPGEVHAALLRGQLHPASQTFDSRPVLAAIEALANGSSAEERDEWNWCMAPANNLREAHFVFLNYPRSPEFKSMHHLLAGQLLRFDVSCFDENLGLMGDWFPPKLNEFQWEQWPGEMLYEISPDELPVLLKRIQPQFSNPDAHLIQSKIQFRAVQLPRDQKILEEQIAAMLEEVEKVESHPPFTLRRQLEDETWVTTRRQDVDQQTATLRRQSDALKAHWEKLLEEIGYGTAFGKN